MLPRFLSATRRRRPRGIRGPLELLEGRLLPSFGTGGIVTTQTASGGTDIATLAIQPADQKIVVAGYNYASGAGLNSPSLLVRYNTDGSLDTTFGSGGIVTTSFGKNHWDTVNSVVVQPNGEIVAGGGDLFEDNKTDATQENLALARYTTTGSLDTSFGTGGEVTTSFPAADGPQATIQTVLLRSDGEIVAVGVTGSSPTLDPLTVLALYKSSGTLDKTFGSKGTVVDGSLNTSTSSPNSQGGTTTVYKYFSASGATLESDNSILITGTYVTRSKVTTSSGSTTWTTNEQDLALVHYLASGTLDTSFGTGGIAIVPITPAGASASNAGGNDVFYQAGGSIVVIGSAAGANGSSNIVDAQFNANGTLNTTFGGGAGYTLVPLASGMSFGPAALQSNRQIVVGGTLLTNPSTYADEFATTRLNANGTLDTTFGSNGFVTTPVLLSENNVAGVGLETINGQAMIVDAATALATSSGNTEIALVRYTSAGALDSGGTAAAAIRIRSAPTSGAIASLAASTLAGEPSGWNSTDLGIATTAGPSVLSVAGLVPQAADAPDFLDTLLSGRKRH